MKSFVLIEKYRSRKCSCCKNVLPKTNEFFQKDNRRNSFRFECKKCHNKKIKEWFSNNKNYRQKYYKEYCLNNKDAINETKQEYRLNRKKIDTLYRLTISIRSLIKSAILKKRFSKQSKTKEILGCTFEEFKIHIESQFEPWMSWDNYGKYNGQFNYGWDLDHTISIHKAKTYEELIKLNHYTNFQPLCSKINRCVKREN